MYVAKLPLDKLVLYILACALNWLNRRYVISTRANSLLPKQALVGVLACKFYIFSLYGPLLTMLQWRLLLAGLYPVEFRDFFLGDMYCSQTYAMGVSRAFYLTSKKNQFS